MTYIFSVGEGTLDIEGFDPRNSVSLTSGPANENFFVSKVSSTKKLRRARVFSINEGLHLPLKILKRRRCVNCSQMGAEVRSKIICSNCNVALCIKGCYKAFHESLMDADLLDG